MLLSSNVKVRRVPLDCRVRQFIESQQKRNVHFHARRYANQKAMAMPTLP